MIKISWFIWKLRPWKKSKVLILFFDSSNVLRAVKSCLKNSHKAVKKMSWEYWPDWASIGVLGHARDCKSVPLQGIFLCFLVFVCICKCNKNHLLWSTWQYFRVGDHYLELFSPSLFYQQVVLRMDFTPPPQVPQKR